MSNQSQNNPGNSSCDAGSRLIVALTQSEIIQLLDAVFTVFSEEQRYLVLDQLQPSTRQTVQQILTPSQTTESTQVTQAVVSSAKLAETWAQLWQEWNDIVWEASQEEGKYIAQEAEWEPPYLDSYSLVEDLEKVAEKMQPLIQTAFEHGFTPDVGFADGLLELEAEISAVVPDWMDISEGFDLQESLTNCLLQWEWLVAQDQEQDAFDFAYRIRQWEDQCTLMSLESSGVVDFFTQLKEVEQRCILAGLTATRETPFWKSALDNAHSHWHQLYIHYIHQYAPERYLDNLRATIPQQWQNGLPVIEDFLTKQDYPQSQVAIDETLAALLNFKRSELSWTPETSLLFGLVGGFYHGYEGWESEKTLLFYYQQTARGLGQTERVNALEIQQIAFEHCFDWPTMFQAFADIPVREDTRQALFQSWRDCLVRQTKPHSYSWGLFATTKTVETWWLHWLIDSIADRQKGRPWFQEQIVSWLASLPGDRQQLGQEYDLLRLLTKDLIEIHYKAEFPYPKFYQLVIRPQELSKFDDASRQAYLQQYAPDNLLDRAIAYWKAQLHNSIPRPELSQKSDYTEHAKWMAVLRELNPRSYQTLLDQWRVDHQRRRNLWKAMDNLGLV